MQTHQPETTIHMSVWHGRLRDQSSIKPSEKPVRLEDLTTGVPANNRTPSPDDDGTDEDPDFQDDDGADEEDSVTSQSSKGSDKPAKKRVKEGDRPKNADPQPNDIPIPSETSH